MSPLFDQMRLQLGDVMNPAAIHTLPHCSFSQIRQFTGLRSELFAGQRVGETALINVTETEIFCHRYLKIDNSTDKEYLLTNFVGFSAIYS